MTAYLFIALMVIAIFAVDAAWRYWRATAWKRRSPHDEDDHIAWPT
jgi:hypothetical protein